MKNSVIIMLLQTSMTLCCQEGDRKFCHYFSSTIPLRLLIYLLILHNSLKINFLPKHVDCYAVKNIVGLT